MAWHAHVSAQVVTERSHTAITPHHTPFLVPDNALSCSLRDAMVISVDVWDATWSFVVIWSFLVADRNPTALR